MAGIPGGRGPRSPLDHAEWLDQRLKQDRNLQPHNVRLLQNPTEVAVNIGDFVLAEKGAVAHLPDARGLAGQTVEFKSAATATRPITIVARENNNIEGDRKTFVGSRGGRLVLMSDGNTTWHRVGGDQNICFHIYKSTNIDNQLLNSTNPFYCDAVLVDTLGVFDAAAPANTTQGTFTVPESGMWTFGGGANADATAAADTCTVTIRIDGTNYLSGCRIGTTGATVDPASIVEVKSVYLVTGQTVYLYATGATNLVIVEGQLFGGFWGRKLPN